MLKILLLWLGFMFPSLALGAFGLQLTPNPNPPEAGKNTFHIVLSDEGKSIAHAKLSVVVSMPAMGSMPYMETVGTVSEKQNGNYVAEYELSMGGTWEVKVEIDAAGKKDTRRYSITTGIPGVSDKNNVTGGQSAPSGSAMDLGPQRLQKIGVRFVEAKVQALSRPLRAAGVVEADNSRRTEIALRVAGVVGGQLHTRVGDSVKGGQPLFSFYSPELVTAQNEFLLGHELGGSHVIHASATERLRNLGMSEGDINEIKRTGKAKKEIVIRAPVSGTVLEANIAGGSNVNAGQVLYVIGDLSKTFIVARVFQQDISQLHVGQSAKIAVPEGDEEFYEGHVDLVYPNVSEGAGTGNVRIVPNKFIRALRPGVYVDVRFQIDLGSKLVIPTEAVLYSGMHRYVFVDKGDGRLEPREIEIGKKAEDLVEVRAGIQVGEKVVASGAFLLSSEAQLRSALPKWKNVTGEK